jgi:hypothetical protein
MTRHSFALFVGIISIAWCGCSTPNTLTVTNNTPHPAALLFDFEGTRDSVAVFGGTSMPVTSSAVASASMTDDIRLRSIAVRNTVTGDLRIHRFSNTYLASKQWKLAFPFFTPDTIPPRSLDSRKYYQLSLDNTLYHLAQEYYNSGEYDKCFYLLDGYIRSGGMGISVWRANTADYYSTYGAERERYIGINLLLYLSKKKTGTHGSGAEHLDAVKQLSPDYAKYLLKHDPEFAP